MCVVITTPGREERPTLRQLELCEQVNPHGSGLAWLQGRFAHYAKGLSAQEIHARLQELDGPAVVHFRIASIGRVCPELRHPFPVTHRAELKPSGRARAVLFQNGTWHDFSLWRDHLGISYGRKEPVSDTRVAASLVARFGFDFLKRADFCRWVLLDAEGIHRIGQWSKLGGCHYSNLYWLRDDAADFWDLMQT